MNTKHFLLIEDDPRDAELTLAALNDRNLGHKIFVVHDGAEALDYLYCRAKYNTRSGGNPIVVLLDNKMPKISGLDVLKTIKTDEHLRMIPVVLLTSSREPPDLIEFYKHGANAYVVKPVDFVEFMNAVKQVGIFWAAINEPPPLTGSENASIHSGEPIIPEKPEAKNESATPHPAT